MSKYICEDPDEYIDDFDDFDDDEDDEYSLTVDDLFCSQLGSKKFLVVITDNGQLILDSHPYETLMRVVEYVGVEKVASFNLKTLKDLPFMSKNPDSFVYNKCDYKLSKDGWYIFTAMNLKGKVAMIEKIGELAGYKFTCATKRIII